MVATSPLWRPNMQLCRNPCHMQIPLQRRRQKETAVVRPIPSTALQSLPQRTEKVSTLQIQPNAQLMLGSRGA